MSTYGGLPMSGGTTSLGETLWGFSFLLVLAALRFKKKASERYYKSGDAVTKWSTWCIRKLRSQHLETGNVSIV